MVRVLRLRVRLAFPLSLTLCSRGLASRPAGAPRGAAPPDAGRYLEHVHRWRQQDEAPEQIFPHTHLHCVHCRKAVKYSALRGTPYGFTLVWSARHTDTDKHGGAWAWPRVYRARALVYMVRDVVWEGVLSNDHNAEKSYTLRCI